MLIGRRNRKGEVSSNFFRREKKVRERRHRKKFGDWMVHGSTRERKAIKVPE
jgi:hypothetical protein